MNDDLLAALRRQFGFSEFRPGQAEAIRYLIAGKHMLAVMPTGAGKSLIYQFAALHQNGVTLVVSPLISLMQDQVESLKRRGIPSVCITSALSTREQNLLLQATVNGDFRIIYVSPERLRNIAFQKAISQVKIDLMAVDEAHCISQWGHDFRPDYLAIGSARKKMKNPTIAAITATATPQVQEDILRRLGMQSAERIVTGFNRPNLYFETHYSTDLASKLEALQKLLGDLKGGAGLVYVGARRDAEEVSDFIREVIGIEADPYHAGMSSDIRARTQNSFIEGKLPIVVATNAFGMGIDRADVRLVAHYSVPGTLEAYYQEAGRAGRDGYPAKAALLYSPQDRSLQEWFIENDSPSMIELRTLYDALKTISSKASLEDVSLASGLHEV